MGALGVGWRSERRDCVGERLTSPIDMALGYTYWIRDTEIMGGSYRGIGIGWVMGRQWVTIRIWGSRNVDPYVLRAPLVVHNISLCYHYA